VLRQAIAHAPSISGELPSFLLNHIPPQSGRKPPELPNHTGVTLANLTDHAVTIERRILIERETTKGWSMEMGQQALAACMKNCGVNPDTYRFAAVIIPAGSVAAGDDGAQLGSDLGDVCAGARNAFAGVGNLQLAGQVCASGDAEGAEDTGQFVGGCAGCLTLFGQELIGGNGRGGRFQNADPFLDLRKKPGPQLIEGLRESGLPGRFQN